MIKQSDHTFTQTHPRNHPNIEHMQHDDDKLKNTINTIINEQKTSKPHFQTHFNGYLRINHDKSIQNPMCLMG